MQIRLEFGGAAHTLEGRENIRNAAFNARSLYTGLTVDFPDMAIEVMPGTLTAEAALTARARAAGDRDIQIYELKFILRKIGGDWLIRRIETARTLK